MSSPPDSTRSQISGVIDCLKSLARRRSGQLRALTLSTSSTNSIELVRGELMRQLSVAGFEGVEIDIVPRGDEVRVVSAEFEISTPRR